MRTVCVVMVVVAVIQQDGVGEERGRRGREGLAARLGEVGPGAGIDQADGISARFLHGAEDDDDVLGEQAQQLGLFHLRDQVDEGVGEGLGELPEGAVVAAAGAVAVAAVLDFHVDQAHVQALAHFLAGFASPEEVSPYFSHFFGPSLFVGNLGASGKFSARDW